MSDELLPCPFCGGGAEMMIESSYYMAGCKDDECSASGVGYVDRDKAVAWWNRRATVWPQGSEAAEQLARAMQAVFGVGLWDGRSFPERTAWLGNAAVVLARLATPGSSAEISPPSA